MRSVQLTLTVIRPSLFGGIATNAVQATTRPSNRSRRGRSTWRISTVVWPASCHSAITARVGEHRAAGHARASCRGGPALALPTSPVGRSLVQSRSRRFGLHRAFLRSAVLGTCSRRRRARPQRFFGTAPQAAAGATMTSAQAAAKNAAASLTLRSPRLRSVRSSRSDSIASSYAKNVPPAKPEHLLLTGTVNDFTHGQPSMRALANVRDAVGMPSLMRCNGSDHEATPAISFGCRHPAIVRLVESGIRLGCDAARGPCAGRSQDPSRATGKISDTDAVGCSRAGAVADVCPVFRATEVLLGRRHVVSHSAGVAYRRDRVSAVLERVCDIG